MATRPRSGRRPARATRTGTFRYTIDASVFVNAFNPHEEGHAESLAFLTAIQRTGDPIIVPTLVLPDIASAMARATNDGAGALQYANATAALPHLTLIPLTAATARQAAELAAHHRLRGADAVYLAVAQRYAARLISRDDEQRSRGAAVATCQTPEDAVNERQAADRPRKPRRP